MSTLFPRKIDTTSNTDQILMTIPQSMSLSSSRVALLAPLKGLNRVTEDIELREVTERPPEDDEEDEEEEEHEGKGVGLLVAVQEEEADVLAAVAPTGASRRRLCCLSLCSFTAASAPSSSFSSFWSVQTNL